MARVVQLAVRREQTPERPIARPHRPLSFPRRRLGLVAALGRSASRVLHEHVRKRRARALQLRWGEVRRRQRPDRRVVVRPAVAPGLRAAGLREREHLARRGGEVAKEERVDVRRGGGPRGANHEVAAKRRLRRRRDPPPRLRGGERRREQLREDARDVLAQERLRAFPPRVGDASRRVFVVREHRGRKQRGGPRARQRSRTLRVRVARRGELGDREQARHGDARANPQRADRASVSRDEGSPRRVPERSSEPRQNIRRLRRRVRSRRAA